MQTSNIEQRSEGLLGAAPKTFGSPDCEKQQNPFRSNARDVLHPQMLLHSNLPIKKMLSAKNPLNRVMEISVPCDKASVKAQHYMISMWGQNAIMNVLHF